MRKMKIILTAIAVAVAIYFILTYSGRLTGIVVDAETGKPIEGAVVLVEWTITTGKAIGLRATDSFKVVEAVTDKDGKFTVLPTLNPLVNPPHLTIYKRGYVAWNNSIIFPAYKKREDFQFKSGNVYKLERFKESYSYYEHYSFISSVAHPESATDKKKIFFAAYDAWEREKAAAELKRKQKGGAQ